MQVGQNGGVPRDGPLSTSIRSLLADTGEWQVVGLAVACALNLGAAMGLLLSPSLRDFGLFYASAQAWVLGLDLYYPQLPIWTVHSQTPGLGLVNLNPPLIALIFVPLTALRAHLAAVVWLAANFLAFVWVWRTVARETAARPVTTLLILAASAACFSTVWTGQLVWLLAVPMTLAWRAARRGDWIRAGVWIGVCAYDKPFLLLFAALFLWKGRWRAAAVIVGTSVALALVGFAVCGVTAHLSWLRAVSSVDWSSYFINISMHGFLARTLTAGHAIRVLWLAVGTILVVATFFAVFLKQTSVDREFAAILLLVLLILPTGWVYYLTLIAGPLVALMPAFCRRRIAPAALGFFWPPFVLVIDPGPLLLGTLYSLYFWAGLVLWFMTVWESPTQSGATAP